MKRIILLLAALLMFFVMTPQAQAATVGFVPSTGVWFSPTTFSPGEEVSVNTVIINDAYSSLNGQVIFLDNGEQIGSVVVDNLTEGTARQVNILWRPAVGEHSVVARLINVSAINEAGETEAVDLSAINSQSGEPLVVANGGTVAPTTVSASGNPATSSIPLVGAAAITVTGTSGEFIIAPAPKTSSTDNLQSADSASAIDSLFAKNRAAFEQAQAAVGAVTTTVAKINGVYTATRGVVNKTQELYTQLQSLFSQIGHWLTQLGPWQQNIQSIWNRVTGNDDPKRVGIVILIVLLPIMYIGWRLRRR